MSVKIHSEEKQSLLGRATAFFVYLFEEVMPDPFVFAVILTFVGALLALWFAPNATLPSVASAWYGGIFAIFAFAFQMVLMLVAGYALAMAPPVQRGLARIAALVSTPLAAISLTIVISMIASWINWGLGLVTAALLAREMAKRVRLDFGWLVAAAYSGFVISTEGLSGSIALSQATHGSALNIVEKVTGRGLPLNQTVFTRFNLVPCLVLLIVLPIIFRALRLTEANTMVADPDRLCQEDAQIHTKDREDTFGSMLDNALILNILLVAFGVFALITEWRRTGFALDLNSVIIMLVLGGLFLHLRPSAYIIGAVKHAARISGSLILQYPLYGGGHLCRLSNRLRFSSILFGASTINSSSSDKGLSTLVACKRSTHISAISLSLLTALLLAVPSQAAPPAPFKVLNTWKLGGDGSWDYLKVDEAAHLLYIARLDRIMVVDIQTGKLVSEIGGLQHAHGVALDDTGRVGYISDGGAGSVLVFDRSTFKVVATIPAGKNPDAVLFEPTQRRVFTFNGASKNATVIDAPSNKVIATIPMPGKPEFSVTDGTGNVFVNIEDTNQLLQIDAVNMKVTATWPLAPCKAPSGLAIDIEHHRLFSVCDNAQMAIVNSQSGKLVAMAPIGEGSDAVAFDSKRGLVLSSNGESGNLTIVHQDSPDQYKTLQTLNTLPGARTLALNQTTGEVYTVSATLGHRPTPTKEMPNPRPPIVPNSFVVVIIGR